MTDHIRQTVSSHWGDYLTICDITRRDELCALLFYIFTLPQFVLVAFYLLTHHTLYAFDTVSQFALVFPACITIREKLKGKDGQ